MKGDKRPDSRLIALEGCSGRELESVARQLQRYLCNKSGGGVSHWDDSGIFYELELHPHLGECPSPRTLILLYAADLSFRLQWQVRPALKKRQCVIVAPYVESAMAFGKAAGLPLRWLRALFRFAPQPGSIYRISEQEQSSKKIKAAEGFVEFACLALQGCSATWNARELRLKAIDYLAEQQRQGACRAVPRSMLRS